MDRRKMIYTELNGIRYGKSYGVFYRYLHRRLWNWLADTHGRKYKKDWPEWAINGGIVPMAESYCFACAALVAHGLRLIHILLGYMTLNPATANVSPEL